MKKILYSGVIKFIAWILMLVSAFQTVNLVTGCLVEYFGYDDEVYCFEETFEDSNFMSMRLDETVQNIFNSFVIYHRDNPENTPLEKVVESHLEEVIAEYTDYRVIVNDSVFTNNEKLTENQFVDRRFNSYLYRDDEGQLEISKTSNLVNYYYWSELDQHRDEKIEIYCALKDDYVKKYEAIWINQRNLIYKTFTHSLALVTVFFACMVYLICTCGRCSDGEIKGMWPDKIPVEIHLCFIALFLGLGLGFAFIVFDELWTSNFPEYMVKSLVPSVTTIMISLVIASVLSLVRKIKCGTFVKTSIICIVAKCLIKFLRFVVSRVWRIMKKLINGLFRALKYSVSALAGKTTLILLIMFVVYTVLVATFTVGAFRNEVWFVLLALVFAFGIFFISVRAKDFEEISKGAAEIRNGNLSYVISLPKSEDMKRLSSNINEIAEGLDESVNAKIRAEKLKTELITNVSHDLKTPLTSIINYTQLLSELKTLPEEAKDYVSIIAKKSDRLKTLTHDLFDISKVQSGNEEINLEKLDVSLLLIQSLGEHDSEICKSGVIFVTDAEKDLFINADGRKLSRVMSNLISNILKYSMKGTRAFATAKRCDDKAVIEFKNISAYSMDFSPDEITSRFIRGDKSRSEEGNGLGLAIAKSYTEACGGSFDIILDGDMFKVIIKYDLS